MKALKLALPAVILLGGFLVSTSTSYGTVAMSKKEKKGCVVCHTKAGSKELNKVGDCYKKSPDLAACQAAK